MQEGLLLKSVDGVLFRRWPGSLIPMWTKQWKSHVCKVMSNLVSLHLNHFDSLKKSVISRHRFKQYGHVIIWVYLLRESEDIILCNRTRSCLCCPFWLAEGRNDHILLVYTAHR